MQLPVVNPRAALLSGLAAGIAYVATAEIDNRTSGRNLDDLKLLGRPLVHNPDHAKSVGAPIHLVNSVVLALLFAYVRRFLPGSSIVQGVTFATLENTILYPIAAFEKFHCGVKRGEIDRFFTLASFLLLIPRNLACGATLGILYDRLSRR